MAAWTLIPSLISLRAEFDALSKTRDRSSDGALGDLAHQAGGTSDHLPDEDAVALRAKDADSLNELHAIDVDNTGPWPAGLTFDRLIQIIVDGQRAGDGRLQNVIWSRKIASRSWNWTARAYTGPSPHLEHAHFSARYGSGTTGNPENDTRPWGLLAALEALQGDDMALATETIDINESNAPLFGGKAKIGDKRSAAEFLGLSAIYAFRANSTAGTALTRVAALENVLAKVLANQGDDASLAQVQASIDQAEKDIVDAVFTRLGGTGQSVADIVALLRPALGARAAEVGRLLQS